MDSDKLQSDQTVVHILKGTIYLHAIKHVYKHLQALGLEFLAVTSSPKEVKDLN